MKPITFDEKNKTLIKPDNMTDKECSSLDVYCDSKQCISLWHMSFRERLSTLVFGRIWIYVLSGKTQPPIALSAANNIFTIKQWSQWKCKLMNLINFRYWRCECHYQAPYGKVIMEKCPKHD